MKKNKYISRILIMALAFAVALSFTVPSFEAVAYAASNDTKAVSGVQSSNTGGEASVTPDAGSTPAAPAVPEPAKAASSFSGYPTVINTARSKKTVISATVTPANGGRLVQLQRYNHNRGKWYTKMRYFVEDGQSSSVSFSIPSNIRQKTSSTWRLYSPATATAEAAVSDDIIMTTRNIKSYKLSAKGACIYRIDDNGEGTLIYSKNANTKRAQASTTKLMTAVLLMESGLLDTRTTISKHAATTPWGSGRLEAGDIYKTHDLLYAMLLPSANDAATAVAERVGKSESAFVTKMNAKAKKMGMTRTHFRNPHGLDADGHYTTPKELAMLTAYAYSFPEIRECWGTQYKTIKSIKKKKKWTLWSTNSIFGYVSNFLGGKTGTEDNAGCCFTGAYEYNGSVYITVVLGSGYGFSRWIDTKRLHNYITKYADTQY